MFVYLSVLSFIFLSVSQAFVAVLRAAFALGNLMSSFQSISFARGAAVSVFEILELVSDSL